MSFSLKVAPSESSAVRRIVRPKIHLTCDIAIWFRLLGVYRETAIDGLSGFLQTSFILFAT
jgi:hypothetical protein